MSRSDAGEVERVDSTACEKEIPAQELIISRSVCYMYSLGELKNYEDLVHLVDMCGQRKIDEQEIRAKAKSRCLGRLKRATQAISDLTHTAFLLVGGGGTGEFTWMKIGETFMVSRNGGPSWLGWRNHLHLTYTL